MEKEFENEKEYIGITIDKVEDITNKATYRKCIINGCSFDNTCDYLENFYENEYVDCIFKGICLDIQFTNNNRFENCVFVDCYDFSKYFSILEGTELYELQKYIEINLEKCKLYKCHIGTNNRNSCISECAFHQTYFKNGKYIESIIQLNNFTKCTFESVEFFDEDITSNTSIIVRNIFEECDFMKQNFSETLFINKFINNNYDRSSVIIPLSKSYIKRWVDFYDKFNKNDYFYNENQKWSDYKQLYFCLFEEYKNLKYEKIAYNYYYYYRYIEMKEHEMNLVDTIKYFNCIGNPLKNLFKDIKNVAKDYINYILFGYGEKPFRLAGCTIFLIFMFALIYMLVGIKGDEIILYKLCGNNFNFIVWIKDFTKAFYLSITNFFSMTQNDIQVYSCIGKIILIIQSILSYVLMAIFTGLVVRNWFRD